MRRDLKEWYQELEKSPEDWSVRIRLVEAAVTAGNDDEARRLVRASPDDGPLPTELQGRIFALMKEMQQRESS